MTLLIKPVSSLCNLRCGYCFYHSLAEERGAASYGMMSPDLLETLVQKALNYANSSCTFGFQGGEPTLAGLDFFQRLIEFERKYNTKELIIHNTIQTNGTLIADEWARFLGEHRFLVGLSLDGPKELHDAHRIDISGRGTFNRVLQAARLFDRHRVDYNILSVIHRQVARHPAKYYNFLKKQGFTYLQPIVCLDPLNECPGGRPYSLPPELYAQFLMGLFDLWSRDLLQGEQISIRQFDNYLRMILGYPPESCDLNGECLGYLVVESNGNVYPCDFFAIDQWCLGNIGVQELGEMENGPTFRKFREISRHVADECQSCQWYSLCRGGCRRNREPFVDGKPALNYYCFAFHQFFECSWEKLHQIAAFIDSQRFHSSRSLAGRGVTIS